jgi:hypothetical protein
MEALTDDCLSASWKVYDAFSGLFAMLAALGMQLIEYIAHQRYRSINSEKMSRTVETDDLSGHCHGLGFQDENETTKISTYLLEFGIALHSVSIGLALGTATDESFALYFHQFFEGNGSWCTNCSIRSYISTRRGLTGGCQGCNTPPPPIMENFRLFPAEKKIFLAFC